MLAFVTVIHVLLCIFMIFVILLQPGKDAGMGSALGGGAATSAFGGRGAVTFLSKLTAICAIGFFVTSLGLSFVGLKSSLAERVAAEQSGNPKKIVPVPAASAQEDPLKVPPPSASGVNIPVPAPAAGSPVTPKP